VTGPLGWKATGKDRPTTLGAGDDAGIADASARQQWVRKTMLDLFGSLPEKTPLNARTVGTTEHPGYRLERVVYESRPKFYVSGNLYVPATGTPPFPGVLFQLGHSWNGKAWGLQEGIAHCARTTRWVLMIDAEVRPAAQLAGSLLAFALARQLAALSAFRWP